MRLAILFLAAIPLFGLDNSIVIRNNFTGALTSYPIAFGRFFARGEITGFPKPYATPSDTGTRAAVTTWQVTELQRWNDTSAAQNISAARAGALSWGTGDGVTSIVATAGVAVITFDESIENLIVLGDQLIIRGAPGNYVYGGSTDGVAGEDGTMQVIVTKVTDTTHVEFLYRAQLSAGGSFQTSGTFTTGITVSKKIDPLEPSDACHITINNHGFYRGDPVTITSIPGLTILNPASDNIYYVTGHTRNAFVTTLRCSGTYTSGGSVTGTSIGAGSFRFGRVAIVTTVPDAGTTKVDFENSTNPCSSGNAAACATAGFDEAEMLAYEVTPGNDWNFNLVATAAVKSGATAAITSNARTMLTAGDLTTPTYCGTRVYARGPVDTVVIVEDGCSGSLAYDFGWKIRPGTTFSASVDADDTQFHLASGAEIEASSTQLYLLKSGGAVEIVAVTAETAAPTTCNSIAIVAGVCVTVTRAVSGTAGTYASARGVGIKQWDDASAAHKSLHPVFTLRFMNGWAGVGGRVEVKNDWIWKMQNLHYSVDLQTGDTPSSRIAKTTFKHAGSTSWQLSTVDGTDPEFYCSAGGDPDEGCAGARKRKYLIDHNTPYLIYARAFPEWRLFPTKTAALDSMATGFKLSDKGAITAATLGKGTWGANFSNPGDTGSSPTTDGQGQQETFVFTDLQALWLQNWSEAGYEIVFGDSNPGGAGNAEAHRHRPIYVREDDDTTTNPRFIMPGFAATMDRANNKPPSTYTRPTLIEPDDEGGGSGTAAAVDKRRTACSSAAPAVLPTDGGVGSSSGQSGWPCYYWQNHGGLDNWIIDANDFLHQQDWLELAYLTTADYRYLEGMQQWVTWNNEFNTTNRGPGKSWAQPESSTSAPRGLGGFVGSVVRAFQWTPNVPQWGFTVPSVDTFYYNEKIWDIALSKEGAWQITDGWFATMYPHIDISVCPGTAAQIGSNIYLWMWCSVNSGKTNPLGSNGLGASSFCGVDSDFPWVDCTTYPTMAAQGLWINQNMIASWSKAAGFGVTAFNHVRQKHANYVFSLFGSSNFNPFLLDLYRVPNKTTGAFGAFLQTIGAMTDAFNETWGGGGCSPRTRDRWCNDGNTTYAVQTRAGLAAMSDLRSTVIGNLDGCSVTSRTPAGCTWDWAWQFINTTVKNQNTWTDIVKFILEPRADITDLVCTPGATTAICTYTAPTNHAGTYAVSTSAFTNTLDADDTTDGGGPRQRRFVVTGLNAATPYYLRLTAGQRVPTFAPTAATGTGRTQTTFTTLTAGGGTTYTYKASAVAGATTVTIEYGDTTAVDDGTVGPTACTSGCTLSIPATDNVLLYYRVTYKNGGGTTIAQGGVQSAIP